MQFINLFKRLIQSRLWPVPNQSRMVGVRNIPNTSELQNIGSRQGEIAAHLRRARALIIRPGFWLQDAYARDADALVVDSKSPDARSFCSSGALFATESPGQPSIDTRALLAEVIQADIEIWNDTPGRTQAEVVEAFDRAIRLAEAPALHAGSKPVWFRWLKAKAHSSLIASTDPVPFERCRP